MVIETTCDVPDVSFQGKHADEEFHLYYHQHWIRLLWPLTKLLAWNVLIAGLTILTFFPFSVEDEMTRHMLLTLLTIFFLFAHFEFLSRFYRHFLCVIVVTDRRVHRIKKSLFTIDDHQSIDLLMLQDIAKRQHSLVQKIFGFGTIILEAQETVLRLHFTPHISEKYDTIVRLKEEARMAYGGGVRYGERHARPSRKIAAEHG